ncbi:MAG: radical SAM/SPASM domain-containing protein [Acidobacteriota bacterium]|nr:radical SAM/SPASM domain-containing protein [Acidobacteriota bacterium]MDY0231178.1 radical SAM/SPASM domain-containing protein [Candidatus Saccharicenans sp.]
MAKALLSAKIRTNMAVTTLKLLTNRSFLRSWALKTASRKVQENLLDYEMTKGSKCRYLASVEAQYIINLMNQGIKNLDKGILSPQYLKKVAETLGRGLWGESNRSQEASVKYIEKYGMEPPAFCTISPTQKCNLNCTGCYASSSSRSSATLPYWAVQRLVKEMRDICGASFTVISGGEPFLWHDGNKNLITLLEEFNDMFFLVYTNGLLIDDRRAKQMLELGNITPAISFEGYEEQTDHRRGPGVFRKSLASIDRLKKYGVGFGVSITATKENINLLLEDSFYEYWFEEIGATYMWMFHLLPIGRAREVMSLVLSPEERVALMTKWEELLFKRGYFIGDFWNSGAASRGCIAYGRPNGYFYVDWNGNIMPCVFVPYYKDNIYELYKNGKTIEDALMSDYFKRGRSWQEEYGYLSTPPGNFLAPCSIRDNHQHFREKILAPDIKPEDDSARAALEDPEYFQKMVEFGEKIRQLTEPLWQDRVNQKL